LRPSALYPLLLQPALHVKVWGGRQLAQIMNKALPTDEPYGEAWELHDTATVTNGALSGCTLAELLAQYTHDLIGADNDASQGFPLLAKLLDASAWLSVQVHPNDAQARQLEGQPRGKTEAWYVIAAEPGAKLVTGLHPGTTRAEIAHATRTNTLERLLIYEEVRAGDVLSIPAGVVHALGPGILLYEIQQSSDTTYRLYDWGRVGLDGKPRPLHIEKSLAVANTEHLPPIRHTDHILTQKVDIVRCPFFATELYQFMDGGTIDFDDSKTFDSLTCIEGSATVESDSGTVTMSLGQTVLVPACIERYSLTGQARVLRSWQAT
jgi:mannose-6-phosphate isomerase